MTGLLLTCPARRVHPMSTDYYMPCYREPGHVGEHRYGSGAGDAWTDDHTWACRDGKGQPIDWRSRFAAIGMPEPEVEIPEKNAEPIIRFEVESKNGRTSLTRIIENISGIGIEHLFWLDDADAKKIAEAIIEAQASGDLT